MTWRERQITKAVQEYDAELYAHQSFGRIDIFRRGFCYEPYDVDGMTLFVTRSTPYRVMCLTDTWNAWGKPVDWGIEPIMAKLRSMDLWKRDIVQDVNAHNEKINASNARSKKSEIEAFVKDYRPQFAKAFDDINTSNMNKRIDRRFRDDKKINLKG